MLRRRNVQAENLRSVICRRDLLKVGPLTLSASVLPGLLTNSANGEFTPSSSAKAKSVIFLWMGGGVTHLDSLDPKPEAPQQIRGTLSAISTAQSGVHFSEVCPHLARIAGDLCPVRSFSHDSDDHLLSQVYTLSGRKVTQAQLFTEPNIGAIVQYLQGPRNGLPGYIAVPGITRPGPPPHQLFVGGWLGNQYGPFCIGGQPDQPDFTVGQKALLPPTEANEDLNPPELRFPQQLTIGRLSRRTELRESLGESLVRLDQSKSLPAMEDHYRGAFNLLTSSKVRDAFDIQQESDAIRDDYGRTKIGGRCLLARRLVESGARFVMVDYGYDPDYGNLWDIHNVPEQRFPHVSEMCKRGYNVAGIDKAFAALITDLKQRGMLDSTLVVYLTEFGRTPKINALGGRDHWGACGSMFFAGAGIRTGQVVGASDKQGAYPLTNPHGPADIAATIYHCLGIDPETRIHDRQGRPAPVLDHGRVIQEAIV